MKTLFALVMGIIAVSAHAETAPTTYTTYDGLTPAASSGHWKLDGSLSFNSYSDEANARLDVNTNVQYFVLDPLAVGIIAGLTVNNGVVGVVGPSADFYFYRNGRFQTSVGTNYRITFTGLTSILNGHLGADYFVTPNVALGTKFNVEHAFTSNNRDYSRINIAFALGFFL